MRIVGGSLRGRRIEAPKGDAVRPTSDRARETLFNMLASRVALDGARVVDAFSGTGALGLEALSRGAGHVIFLDRARASADLTARNVAALGMGARARVCRVDATRPGPAPAPRCDLALLDPPYGQTLGERAMTALAGAGWLANGALCVLEERSDAMPHAVAGFSRDEVRRLGETSFGFWTFLGDGGPRQDGTEGRV